MMFIGPVNLGNPQEFTIIDLANKILDLTGSKSKIIFSKMPDDDQNKENLIFLLRRKFKRLGTEN